LLADLSGLQQWATVPKALAEALERCPERELAHRYPHFAPVLQALDSVRKSHEKPTGRDGNPLLALTGPAASDFVAEDFQPLCGNEQRDPFVGGPGLRPRPLPAGQQRGEAEPCRGQAAALKGA
jgi:hypothetical protein